MKKIAFLVVTSSLFLAGCPKHEIIPAPTPKVELKGHFEGEINGTDVELTENVDGYFIEPTKVKVIKSGSDLSTAVYSSEFKSETDGMGDIRLSMGYVYWDATLAENPTLAIFNSFFKLTVTPPYAIDAADGFEVVYTDGLGKVRKSDPTRMTPRDVGFFNIVQESDGSGDYSKFKCTFNCYVYYRRPVVDTIVDSIPITNATFTGWFQR